VILDLYLNGFRGWDLLDEIKGNFPNLPILIVTAYDTYAEDARLSKADGYIIKNLDGIKRLKRKIAHILN
jgi:two-component SAPR family response regulator